MRRGERLSRRPIDMYCGVPPRNTPRRASLPVTEITLPATAGEPASAVTALQAVSELAPGPRA